MVHALKYFEKYLIKNNITEEVICHINQNQIDYFETKSYFGIINKIQVKIIPKELRISRETVRDFYDGIIPSHILKKIYDGIIKEEDSEYIFVSSFEDFIKRN